MPNSHSFPLHTLSLAVLLLCVPLCQAVSEIKINAGGLAIGGFAEDPVSFVQGPDKFHRTTALSGLTVGLSHRWGNVGGFTYNLPTGNGEFDIDLIFAEIWPGAQVEGARVFDVAFEDTVAIKNLDVYQEIGLNKELTKTVTGVTVNDQSLTITFIELTGKNHPMVSGLIITKADGTDIPYNAGTSGEGVGTPADSVGNKGFDHQAHAVAGGPYTATDFNNDGEFAVDIDGTNSHTHYNNPETEESGFIAAYSWTVNGVQISNEEQFSYRFPVGTTTLQLTVTDSEGDSATAVTQVIVYPAEAGGAYCYYYLGQTTLDALLSSDPKPDAGYSSESIDFEDDEFPYENKHETTWAARCVTDFASPATKTYTLGVQYVGAGAQLFINGVKRAEGGASGPTPKSLSVSVVAPMGQLKVQVLYFRNGDSGSLKFLTDKVVAKGVLGFKSSAIIPAILSTTVKVANPDGGGPLQIKGTGFFNNAKVKIGASEPEFVAISANEVVVSSIPSQADAGGADVVSITVSNNAGVSNSVQLEYSDSDEATQGVAWEETYMKNEGGGKFALKQITSVAIGPDSYYYVGSLSGFVTKFTAGKDLKVKNLCTGPNMGDSRTILGLAFDYGAAAARVYVTTNSLYFAMGGPFKDKVGGWANGKVESLTSGCGCLCYEKVVVSGLPVSNHDHGLNGLLFLPNGDLLIAIGGSTNAGHNTPGNKLGGGSETPLSGCIAVAKMSLGSGFDGSVTYDQYTNPAAAKQTGGDVEVYAAGMRNCFGMALRTNGEVWATDNGGNFGYGDVSTGCNSQVGFSTKQYDEINLVKQGGFYGHPNRNRGQCVYGQGAIEPKAKMPSASTGIFEYSGNVFGNDLKEKLIVGKYAASGDGILWRVEEKENGEINPVQMAGYSGLSLTVGLHGELIMPRVQQGFVAVMKPKYKSPDGPFVIAVGPRRGLSGQRVFVSGEGFKQGMVVKFGGKVAENVQVENEFGLKCDVPAGTGKVSVVVTVDGVDSVLVGGSDFIYG